MAERVAELEQEVERARQEVDELRCRLQEREESLHASEAALALERARVAAAERAVAMGGGVDAPPGLGDDELPDEVVLMICSFLGVRELGRLACVSQRFAEKFIAAPSRGGVAAAPSGGDGTALGGGLQRAGARVGTSAGGRELAVPDARGGGASAAAGVRSVAWLGHAV